MFRQLVLPGDSLTEGVQGLFSQGAGGRGCWADFVTELLAAIAGVGPLISSGFRGCHLGDTVLGNIAEWTIPATTTAIVSTDAFDVYPAGVGRWANGATKIWTWTKPARYRSIVGFALYWINKTSGGNWQYRIDGGTWTNMGQTLGGATANKMCKFYISTPITTTLDIRASSDATTGVDCAPAGIEAFYLPPTTSQGLIVHDIAVNASELHDWVLTTSGDRLAFFDSVQAGSGSPISNTPNAGVSVMHINDTVRNNTTVWNTDLTTFNTRVSPLGPVGFVNPYECATANYPQAQQTSYRAQTKTSAASLGAKVHDLYDDWVTNGWTGNSAANTAGLLLDLTHPSQAGHIDIGPRMYWFIRNQILALGAVPTSYPVAAKSATTAFTGAKTSVAFGAGAPIAVG